jgi:Antitoxin SocA-like, Panacea domain
MTTNRRSAKSDTLNLVAALGIRHRIAFPFSPQKAVATLHFLADKLAHPRQIEHPLLRLRGMMAVLWMTDAKHFQIYGRPVTGSRWQAYPQGPVARDIIDLIHGNPLWLAELTDTGGLMPFELVGDHVTRNLRVPFKYDPRTLLSTSDQTVLRAALKKAQDLKATNRAAALKSDAYYLTPLYEDIAWELLLPPRLRKDETINEMIQTARRMSL